MRPKMITAALLCLTCALTNAPATNLTGIAHVAFRVSSLEKTRQFYEKLGFEQAFDFKDGHGNVTQAFIKINDRQFIELYPRTQDGKALGLTHVCYESDDIESVRNSYMKEGLNPPETKKARAGNLLFVMHDPEDQFVEFTQYLPGSLHSEDQGKHLGAHRISDHLAVAILPVTNVDKEREYYARVLVPSSPAGQPATFKVGSDQLKLEAHNANTIGTIIFRVENEKRVQKTLQELGLSPKFTEGTVRVHDPDGNAVEFSSAH